MRLTERKPTQAKIGAAGFVANFGAYLTAKEQGIFIAYNSSSLDFSLAATGKLRLKRLISGVYVVAHEAPISIAAHINYNRVVSPDTFNGSWDYAITIPAADIACPDTPPLPWTRPLVSSNTWNSRAEYFAVDGWQVWSTPFNAIGIGTDYYGFHSGFTTGLLNWPLSEDYEYAVDVLFDSIAFSGTFTGGLSEDLAASFSNIAVGATYYRAGFPVPVINGSETEGTIILDGAASVVHADTFKSTETIYAPARPTAYALQTPAVPSDDIFTPTPDDVLPVTYDWSIKGVSIGTGANLEYEVTTADDLVRASAVNSGDSVVVYDDTITDAEWEAEIDFEISYIGVLVELRVTDNFGGANTLDVFIPVRYSQTDSIGLLADHFGFVLTATKADNGVQIRRYNGTNWADTALIPDLTSPTLWADLTNIACWLLARHKTLNQWQLWQSTEVGTNWSFMSVPFDAGTFKAATGCGTREGFLLAVAIEKSSGGLAVRLSRDGGVTWHNTEEAPTGEHKTVSLAPALDGQSRLYLTTDAANYFSDDLGDHWTPIP